jgi:uncharacterized protein involved in exopolysaccharide biosynthesis
MNPRIDVVHEAIFPWRTRFKLDREILGVVWNRRLLIAVGCLTGAVFGVVASMLVEPKYSSTAVVQLDLGGRDDYGQIDLLGRDSAATGGPAISIDGSRAAETFARLISTEAVARRVVNRLHLHELQAERSIVSRLFDYLLPVSPSKIDRATSGLLEALTVASDLRSYVITVTFTAKRPEDAATIANAVLSEALQIQLIQKLTARQAFAQRVMRELSVTYGDEHPLIARAKANLQAVDKMLEAQQNRTEPLSEFELAATGNIVPAQPGSIPSSLKPKTLILLTTLAGLILAISFVLFTDRKKWLIHARFQEGRS